MRIIKASVIIPVYNAGDYLRKCLESVLAQTFHEYEIICVDDGSTDTSRQILEEYCKKHRNIRILEQKNKGAGAARNLGLLNAQGEYVFFLDSDDFCHRNLLTYTISIADRERADIVCFDFARMSQDGTKKNYNGYHREWLPKGVTTFSYRDCPDHILSVVNPTPWNKLFRRSFLLEKKLRYDEISSTNDISFSAVSCAMAGKIAVVDKVLYCYRIGHGNTITSTKTKNLKNVIIALESTIKQVKAIPYYEEIKKALARFVLDNCVYVMEHYVPDFYTASANAFYSYAHELFSTGSLSAIQPVGNNDSLYYKYKIIQKHSYEALTRIAKKRIIVSLTSYPARIRYVYKALDTVYEQTRKADEVILWLAEEQFPQKEASLPERLINDTKEGKLTIRWCEDLKPHKKYFYAVQEFRNDLIITVDDDLMYDTDMIRKLWISYVLNPDAVSTVRAHLITFDEEKNILPYEWWIKEFDGHIGKPSKQLFCTGGAGALYPAELFPVSMLDKKDIIENSLYADDIWLKILETELDIPVVVICKYQGLRYVEGTQKERLFDRNEIENDKWLSKSIAWLDNRRGNGFFQNELLNESKDDRAFSIVNVISYYRGLLGIHKYERGVTNTSLLYIYDTMAHLTQEEADSKNPSYAMAKKQFKENFWEIMKLKDFGKSKKIKAILLRLNLYGPLYRAVNKHE